MQWQLFDENSTNCRVKKSETNFSVNERNEIGIDGWIKSINKLVKERNAMWTKQPKKKNVRKLKITRQNEKSQAKKALQNIWKSKGNRQQPKMNGKKNSISRTEPHNLQTDKMRRKEIK